MKRRHYELTVILDGDLEEESAEKAINEVETTLRDLNTDIVNLERWGHREFEYSIEGKNSGYYAFFLLNAPTSLYDEIQTPLNLNDAVLRHLLVTASDWKVERAKAAEESAEVEIEQETPDEEPEPEKVQVGEEEDYEAEPVEEPEEDVEEGEEE